MINQQEIKAEVNYYFQLLTVLTNKRRRGIFFIAVYLHDKHYLLHLYNTHMYFYYTYYFRCVNKPLDMMK